MARHYLYRSATDVPAPRNDTNLIDDKGEKVSYLLMLRMAQDTALHLTRWHLTRLLTPGSI